MHDMEILGEFLYEVGEQEWKKEWDKRYFSVFDNETMQKAFQRINAVNDALLNVMIEIYGMDRRMQSRKNVWSAPNWHRDYNICRPQFRSCMRLALI